jgi:predicted acetyltransferase
MASSNVNTILPTVTLASEQDRPVIFQLLQFMLYDLSPHFGEWISRDGRYVYEWFDSYWIEPDRYPYLICRQEQLVGFALVMSHSPISRRTPCWFMAEFFILKAQRQQGHGQAALKHILTMHPVNWEIATFNKNQRAVSFWTNALLRLGPKDLQRETHTHDKLEWTVQTFVS